MKKRIDPPIEMSFRPSVRAFMSRASRAAMQSIRLLVAPLLTGTRIRRGPEIEHCLRPVGVRLDLCLDGVHMF